MAAKVHLAECRNYDREQVRAAVRQCLGAVAPAGLIGPGARVLLKPNVINDMVPERAVCTHPEIVRAVAEWALECGGEVVIGDQPGYAMTEVVETAFSNTGMIEACRGLDVTLEFEPRAWQTGGLFLLASVLERFLALHATINSFTRTRVVLRGRPGNAGAWAARSGTRVLA